jgi:hypothetical protein
MPRCQAPHLPCAETGSIFEVLVVPTLMTIRHVLPCLKRITMPKFMFNPNHVYKIQDQKLLFVSTDPDQNELYEFEGLGSTILTALMSHQQFTYAMLETLLNRHKADAEDLKTLWDFCIEKQIIIPAV